MTKKIRPKSLYYALLEKDPPTKKLENMFELLVVVHLTKTIDKSIYNNIDRNLAIFHRAWNIDGLPKETLKEIAKRYKTSKSIVSIQKQKGINRAKRQHKEFLTKWLYFESKTYPK